MRHAVADVLSTAAVVAASGSDVEEKVQEILHALERVVRVDGWMVWQVNPVTGERTRLFAKGYPDHLMAYLDQFFEVDVVAPFSQAKTGWPARVRDTPFDPLELRCMSDFYLPVGFVEGLVAPLTSVGGRCTGFLDASTADLRHPSDEARGLMRHVARILGRLVDPVEESRRAAAVLGGETFVFKIGDGRGERAAVGTLDVEVIRPRSEGAGLELVTCFRGLLSLILESTGGWWANQFVWEGPLGEWYRCRCMRCRGGGVVVGVSPLEQRPYGLSRRELEVLTLVVEGMSNDQIAKSIAVTTRTVKAHVEHILKKLEVQTRAAATTKAIRHGTLLRPPSSVPVHAV